MARRNKKMSKSSGLLPGTLVHIGNESTEKVKITVIDYDADNFQEKVVDKIEDVFPFKDKPTVTWINIDGIHILEIIEKVGNKFDLHPLIMEDVVNTGQRPKLEDFESYLFIVLKMLDFDPKEGIVSEQVSLILGKNYLISFQEKVGDIFNSIRERIRSGKGRIRKMGADYLTYALIDAIVDHYFVIIEKLGERIEGMEDSLINNPDPKILQTIHGLRRDTIYYLRKNVWPLREVISGIQRSGSTIIDKKTEAFFRDVYDHTIQAIDTVETFRDMLSSMLDIYLSSMSNKMNEIMKVLTIIATIFIPLTFIAGVYGMNFKFMPELNWRVGYFIVLGLMALVAILMLVYFRRRRWL